MLGPGSTAKNMAKMLTSRNSCSASKEMNDIKENMYIQSQITQRAETKKLRILRKDFPEGTGDRHRGGDLHKWGAWRIWGRDFRMQRAQGWKDWAFWGSAGSLR